MSIKVTTSVWYDDTIKSRMDLITMLAIADNANDNGEAYPSVDTIAKKTRSSVRGVQEAISRLEASKHLEVVHGGGKCNTNLYKILGKPNPAAGASPQALHPAATRGKSAKNPRVAAPEPSGTSGTSGTVIEKDNKPSAFSDFVGRWCESFELKMGERYDFHGGRDGQAVKALLKLGLSVDDLIQTAIKAWANAESDWNCEKALSISGFRSQLQSIRHKFGMMKKQPDPSDPIDQTTGKVMFRP